jgi:hypothetical protein
MLEVGKKYRYGERGLVAECKMITEGKHRCAVVVYDDGSIDGVSEAEQDNWTEYKEPVTITKYAYVVIGGSGFPIFGNGLCDSPKEVTEHFKLEKHEGRWSPGAKIVATIPVTYTEENGA